MIVASGNISLIFFSPKILLDAYFESLANSKPNVHYRAPMSYRIFNKTSKKRFFWQFSPIPLHHNALVLFLELGLSKN